MTKPPQFYAVRLFPFDRTSDYPNTLLFRFPPLNIPGFFFRSIPPSCSPFSPYGSYPYLSHKALNKARCTPIPISFIWLFLLVRSLYPQEFPCQRFTGSSSAKTPRFLGVTTLYWRTSFIAPPPPTQESPLFFRVRPLSFPLPLFPHVKNSTVQD